ncbi:hypothetical protein B0O99DRAFT_644487 [Bisporella sp. PMI_857]|nr:hypothetical protein B0O99DRAFT_644487 [Bisporella sp. PMI_857]
MRSHLTRSVFRQLISNQPLRFRCPQAAQTLRPHNVFLPRRRNLFGFGKRTTREPRSPQFDPGFLKMNELWVAQTNQTRPPTATELVTAWKAFIQHKLKKKEALISYEADRTLRSFQFLKKARDNGELEAALFFTRGDMLAGLQALETVPQDSRETHNRLARELYQEIVKCSPEPATSPKTTARRSLKSYMKILIDTGDSKYIRDLLRSYLHEDYPSPKTFSDSHLWAKVVDGFARDGDEEELLETLQMMHKLGVKYSRNVQQVVVNFYAGRNDIEATRKWYGMPLEPPGSRPTPPTLSTILHFCTRNNQEDWCKDIFREITAGSPDKETWDIILQWASSAMGKGVEEVEQMMQVMARSSPEDDTLRPDVTTINGLVSSAISRNDSYLAERFITMGTKHGIYPNAETHLLQMDYRIAAGDLGGAQAAYDALQSAEIENDTDLLVINKYIRALCLSPTSDYDHIVSILSDLDQRSVRLEADTVSAMCRVYLERGEMDLTLDLLNTHAWHCTAQERVAIRTTLLEFAQSSETEMTDSWETYILAVQVFDEMPLETRTQLMEHFFKFRRGDMALHVFGHMRAHNLQNKRPVLSTYVTCFEGIADCADRESLDIAYNMLKMDSSIEPNTLLYNALMRAYTECDHPFKAMQFWDEITNSREGPTYRSLELVFRTLERKPFGEHKAREIWAKMRRMEIEITKDVFTAYICCLGGKAKLQDAYILIEKSEKEFGLNPDFMLLGMFYNAALGQNRKDAVEEWAKAMYPEIWTELERLGQKTMKEGHRMFQLPGIELRDEPDEDDDEYES